MANTQSCQVSGNVQAQCLLLAVSASNSTVGVAHSVLERLSYSVYGSLAQRTDGVSLLAFNGEYLHGESGLYLLGNGKRAFSPLLMRFLSPDSLSPFRAGGINAYAYCMGDPINRIDPSGQAAFFSKPFNWLRKRLFGPPPVLRKGTERVYLNSVQTTFDGTDLGGLTEIMAIPHISEMIIRQLPSDDVMALSATSGPMNALVHRAAKPLPQLDIVLLGDKITPSLEQLIDGNRAMSIAKGWVGGMMPSQLIRAGINPNKILHQRLDGESGPTTIQAPNMKEANRWLRSTQDNWRVRTWVNRYP